MDVLAASAEGRVAARIGAQRGDRFEEHPAVTDRTNADFLQVLLREAREDRSFISLSRNAASYLSEAQAAAAKRQRP